MKDLKPGAVITSLLNIITAGVIFWHCLPLDVPLIDWWLMTWVAWIVIKDAAQPRNKNQ